MEEKSQTVEDDEPSFWSENTFIQTTGPSDKEKIRTINMRHDEEMDFQCSSCKAKISAHNRDWHNEMCDNCFNKEFFPDGEI